MNRILALFVVLLSTQAFGQFKIPPMQTTTLPNGLTVILIPQKEVPLLNVTFAVRAGSIKDGSKWGLASLTAGAIDLGTKTYSKAVIEETFDQNGFTLETGISREFLTVDVGSASEDAETLFTFLGEMIRYPTYPKQEVVKLRDRSVSQLRKSKDSPNQIAGEVFDRIYFKEHPYAHPANGVAESVQKMTSDDLKLFHKENIQPQISAIVVAGDFDTTKIQSLIQKNFGSWPRGSATPAEVSRGEFRMEGNEVVLIDKPDSHETTFRIGGQGVANLGKNWPKIAVLNTILGGRFTSLLNEALRVKSGYTYGARSRFNEFRKDGSFMISTFTANETTFKTLDLALETYKGFLEKGIDQATLDSAKAYVKGQFPPQYETLSSLSALAAELWVHEVTLEEFNRFEDEVNALTLAEANQLIRETFPKDGLRILIIGKGSELRPKLSPYGKLREYPLNILDTQKIL